MNKNLGINIGCFLAGGLLVTVVLKSTQPSASDQSVSWEEHKKQTQSKQSQEKAAISISKDPAQRSILQSKIIQLEGVSSMLNEEGTTDLVVVPTELLEDYASRIGGQDLHASLFGADKRVEELLNISDQEKMQLQQGWRDVQKKLKNAEVAKMEVEETEDGSVSITLPDLSEQAIALSDQYKATVGAVLGENRGKAFASIKQLDTSFAKAAVESTYLIKMESTGDGYWRYHIKQNNADGSRAWVGTKIPARLRHMTELANIVSELKTAPEESE